MTSVPPADNFAFEPSLMEAPFMLRIRQGWNQESVAKSLRVPLRTLRSWEQGTRNPSGEAQRKLAQFIRRHT